MTREIDGYTVDEHNVIIQPGKFEHEHIFVARLWELAASGCSSDEAYDGEMPVSFFTFDADDRAEFPEITEYGIALYEDSNGFVNSTWYDAEDEYYAALAVLEGSNEEEEEDERENLVTAVQDAKKAYDEAMADLEAAGEEGWEESLSDARIDAEEALDVAQAALVAWDKVHRKSK